MVDIGGKRTVYLVKAFGTIIGVALEPKDCLGHLLNLYSDAISKGCESFSAVMEITTMTRGEITTVVDTLNREGTNARRYYEAVDKQRELEAGTTVAKKDTRRGVVLGFPKREDT